MLTRKNTSPAYRKDVGDDGFSKNILPEPMSAGRYWRKPRQADVSICVASKSSLASSPSQSSEALFCAHFEKSCSSELSAARIGAMFPPTLSSNGFTSFSKRALGILA